jgi:hypothetical protein
MRTYYGDNAHRKTEKQEMSSHLVLILNQITSPNDVLLYPLLANKQEKNRFIPA